LSASALTVEVDGKTLDQAVREFECRVIAKAMNAASLNKHQAARSLGITVKKLNAKLAGSPIRFRAVID
jgi:DNA-binding NtrC family response regulator